MKKNIVIVVLLCFYFGGFSQDPKAILQKSREKCQSIKQGYFEMTKRQKFMSGNDTSSVSHHCHFKRTEVEGPFSSLFHARSFYTSANGGSLFTGNELVFYSLKDSTGTIMNMSNWETEIEERSDDFEFYPPLTSKSGHPLPDDMELQDSTSRFQFLGKESLRDVPCLHFQFNSLPDNEGSPIQILDVEFHYWIHTSDMIPVQYSVTVTVDIQKDTMIQYELFTLNRYDLNTPIEDSLLTLSSIPGYIHLIDYTPYNSPAPLPIDTIAPDWSFPSLTDEMISLSSLRGKIVLLDFFYKSCFPCMQALPALQSLHEKYKDQGLVVIGLDPYDTKKDNLSSFLSKRDVDYTVLYASKEIAKTYRVSGYPTMFLIDKEGKIINIQIGYGEGVEAELEKAIKKHL